MKSNLTSEQEREFIVEILVYPTDLRHDWFQKTKLWEKLELGQIVDVLSKAEPFSKDFYDDENVLCLLEYGGH